MDQEELIKKQRLQIEELQKKLSDILPESSKLNNILGMFQNMPELDKLKKTAEDLQKFATSFDPLLKIITSIPKDDLEKMMKQTIPKK